MQIQWDGQIPYLSVKVYCEKCKQSYSVKDFYGYCKKCGADGDFVYSYKDYMLMKKYNQIPEHEREYYLEKAHLIYDENTFCPKCKQILTGLHMQSKCYSDFIKEEAYKLYKKTINNKRKVNICHNGHMSLG